MDIFHKTNIYIYIFPFSHFPGSATGKPRSKNTVLKGLRAIIDRKHCVGGALEQNSPQYISLDFGPGLSGLDKYKHH